MRPQGPRVRFKRGRDGRKIVRRQGPRAHFKRGAMKIQTRGRTRFGRAGTENRKTENTTGPGKV